MNTLYDGDTLGLLGDRIWTESDMQKVKRDLLPHLPATAAVDPRVRDYLTTGRTA